MKLSEAILIGCGLRPESHRDRFCRTDNDGILRSDPWGAACEAIMPTVVEFNWDTKDKVKLNSTMEAFRAIQLHYFSDYWKMPAVCPGARQELIKQGGRIVNHDGKAQLKVYDQGAKAIRIGITSECDKVEHLAGMVDHLFYRHNWSREQVGEAVKWYEETRTLGTFQHHQSPSIAELIRQRLTEPLSAYPKLPKVRFG